MSNRRYTGEFKSEAVKQITGRGYKVREVAERLGISTKSIYVWLREAKRHKGSPEPECQRGRQAGELGTKGRTQAS